MVIPENALPDASKLFVKVHPGVFSQVLEGADGILRMPGGCFEQTSSSAYPNVLVVDYMKRTHTENPAAMMKAEQYLNAGYQRLLTFEHKTGGFDWWGQESNEPLIWVSAYGLQEFNDMAKVYPVDRGVIDRTQAWLMKQQAADGTWDKIGMTHSETIASMGDPKLLLTSYVAWSLLGQRHEVAAAGKVDRLHPRSRQGLGQRLHPGPGGQRPGGVGRQGRQHPRRAGARAEEAGRAAAAAAGVEGHRLPDGGPVAGLRPRREPDGGDDGPGGAGDAPERPVPQRREQGARVPGQVEGRGRDVGQHVGDDPVAQGADPGGRRQRSPRGRRRSPSRSTARRRPRARSPSRTPT